MSNNNENSNATNAVLSYLIIVGIFLAGCVGVWLAIGALRFMWEHAL